MTTWPPVAPWSNSSPPAPSDRRLDHTELPYVYLDATYLHVRNSHWQVVSMAVVVATGIPADGAREVLGLDVGDSEEEEFWRTFLTELKKRLWRDVTVSTVYPHASAHPRQP